MAHHRFAPEVYHNTIGPHDPVLHIADGDPVVTTTADARGYNAAGERVADGGNPQTGPFYIDGAERGDTLAVSFDHMAPNRGHGWTRAAIAPNVMEPGYRPGFPDDVDLIEWAIDFEANTASPKVGGPLQNLVLPLRPMLGCFGVAPSRGQAIGTGTSGSYGGNMDYNGFTEGVTVYLPVSVPGALFHLGDGHAVQGDGEIVGTGIEISFDVTFTARVEKGETINWPRGESSTHIFTVGNARPLDGGVEHATTEMVRWLVSGYGLSVRDAHILLGQVVEYDLGNMFDPAYTMVCKVSKEVLTGIGATGK